MAYLFAIPIFLVSLTVHEYAHAYMAYRYGDDTAKRMGRLTLNPLAHISLFGTIILPLIAHFGWAKPVPVDFSVLTKRQMFNVAAAGPAVNLLMAVVLAGAFHILRLAAVPAVGNFVLLAILANLMLAVFNLIPVPPLDGSRLVYAKLKSPEAINAYDRIARYGILIVIGFLLLGGFRYIIWPVVGLLYVLLGLPVPVLTIRDVRAKNRRTNTRANSESEREIMEKSEKKRRSGYAVGQKGLFARAGRSIVPAVIGMVIVVAVGYGVYWVIKSVGQATEEYAGAMIETKAKALRVTCQTNLHTIWQNLQMYAIDEDAFPPSLELLVQWGANPDLLRCPDPNGQEYAYMAGQDQDMDGRNILVYEAEIAHEGGCNVLRLNGKIELLSPGELEMALGETKRRLGR